jgi:hypothetical protein
MKHFILRSAAVIFAFVFSSSLSAQDPWILSARDGFSSPGNSTVFGFGVFGGNIYAAMGPDSGFVYRSSTGNLNSWTKVFSYPASRSVDAITSTPVGGGNMYIAANAGWPDTSRVFQSTDGQNWNPFFVSSSWVSEIIPFKGLGSVDSIYIVEKNSGGDHILKTHYNSFDLWNTSSQWDTVLNFEQSNPLAGITCIAEHNGKLYIGTSSAQLWSSPDGNTWTMNGTVGTGFGDLDNKAITAITSFMGKIFVGTDNNTDGAQLWSSPDNGITWGIVHQFPYENETISSLGVADGKLWMTVTGYQDGVVAKSADGITIAISDEGSFGNSDNNGRDASVIQFGNNIYWGGEHNGGGAKSVFSSPGAQSGDFVL